MINGGDLMRAAAALLISFLFALPPAEAFPDKPVRIIVPFGSGGTADALARLLGPKLGSYWGQPVVVENKLGANGIIGTEAVAKSPADGYTLLIAVPDSMAINPGLHPKLPYSPLKDFAPVTLLARSYLMIMVHPNVQAGTLTEFVKLAKSKPGAIAYGSWGTGSTGHLAMEYFNLLSGTQMIHVPYKAVSTAYADLIGGQVQAVFTGPVFGVPNSKAGKVRVLAVAGPQRHPGLADVPTTTEAGMPDLIVDTWYGVVTPAGVSAEIREQLNRDFVRAIGEPEVKEKMVQGFGLNPVGTTTLEFGAILQADLAKWGDIIRRAKVTVDR